MSAGISLTRHILAEEQANPKIMVWCLATQLVGFLLVAAVTALGTMLVFYAHVLRRSGG